MPTTRVPSLDGIRGLAIVSVVVAHVLPVPLGALGPLGVLVFFVLSGYLITALLLGEFAARGRIDYRQFMVRRVLRLGPAMVAVLAAYLLVLALVPGLPTSPVDGARAAGVALTFLTDVAAGTGFPVPVEMTPHWSLAVEEHFYLFWPLLLGLGLRRGAYSAGSLVRVVLILALLLGFFTPIAFDAAGLHAYFLPTSWIHALAVGAVVAVGLNLPRERGLLAHVVAGAAHPVVVVTAFALMVALVVTATLYGSPTQVLVVTPLQSLCVGALLTAVLVQRPDQRGHALLSLTPLRWLGSVSYGLYLLNLPVIVFAVSLWGDRTGVRVGAAGVAVLLSWGLRQAVEVPAMRLKVRVGEPRSAVRLSGRDRTADPAALTAS